MTVPPDVGKTHLAIGLGLKAIEHGYRVLFTTAAVLIAALTKALAEGRLDDKLKVYTMPVGFPAQTKLSHFGNR